jgi:hypothetical protein
MATVSPDDVDVLRRTWFAGTEDDRRRLTKAQLDVLQAWHETQGHQRKDPINGSCFCCCEDCPPDE